MQLSVSSGLFGFSPSASAHLVVKGQMTQVVGVGIVNLVSSSELRRYEVLTQEPVIVVEQHVIELLNKMINKGQVRALYQYCCDVTAGTLTQLRWIADIRGTLGSILQPAANSFACSNSSLQTVWSFLSSLDTLMTTFDSLAASVRLID